LDTFQYDTDQSFAIFMLNADGTVYGRFGTRSHRTQWFGDVSLEGLAAALRGALELHADYPQNRSSLAGKRGKPLEFAAPEEYPSLKDNYTDRLNYEGNVVQSCIHCHQIGEARRQLYWDAGKPIPDQLLYAYPHPKSIGMILDPRQRATLQEVIEGSPAADVGLRGGDVIESFDGQPMLSIADLQWVLHQLDPRGGTVPMRITRAGRPIALQLALDDGWREADDISWRVSTWSLRRIVTGGLVLKPLAQEQRRSRKIDQDAMALEVTHVGQYNAHAAAKRAGFQTGDVLIAYDGRSDLMTEADLMHHALNRHRVGDRVEVRVLRGGQTTNLALPIQR
jgi:hypothetical protein